MLTAAQLGAHCTSASPKGFAPKADIIHRPSRSPNNTGGSITLLHDPVKAVTGADAVYTDVCTSMGFEHEATKRAPIFKPYQVNEQLMAHAAPHAVFMHCLPAHRNAEVTDAVLDGPQSVVFDQAENRMHAQKALLLMLLGGTERDQGNRRSASVDSTSQNGTSGTRRRSAGSHSLLLCSEMSEASLQWLRTLKNLEVLHEMSVILESLPVGQKVGIAFSGGLDTSAALHWMKQKGALPLRLYRQSRPARRSRLRRDPAQGARVRRRKSPPHRLPRPTGSRRHRRPPVRRLPHLHRRRHLLQHHAPRPRRHRHDAGHRHEGRRRQHLGRRLDLQGQRHRALLSLRPARQSRACKVYKPWLDPAVHRRTRRPRRNVGLHDRKSGFGYKMSAEKAYSTDSNILGATHEAKDLEQLSTAASGSSTPSWALPSGATTVDVKREEVTVRFEEGHPVALNGKDVRRPGRAVARSQRASAAATASA